MPPKKREKFLGLFGTKKKGLSNTSSASSLPAVEPASGASTRSAEHASSGAPQMPEMRSNSTGTALGAHTSPPVAPAIETPIENLGVDEPSDANAGQRDAHEPASIINNNISVVAVGASSPQSIPHAAASNEPTVEASPAPAEPERGHVHQGPTRVDKWLARATLVLKLTKDASEAAELLAPLKAACGGAVTLLEAVQATRDTRDAWNDLVASIKRHQSGFLKNLESNKINKNTLEGSSLETALETYEGALAKILAAVLKVARITDADIESSGVAKLKQLIQGVGTAQIEAGEIKYLKELHTEAYNMLMGELLTFTAATVQRIDENRLLEKLLVPGLSASSLVPECLPGTRRTILNEIKAWIDDVDKPNILWLRGHPGAGKSATTSSVVESLRASDRPHSKFFFQRQQAAEMKTTVLWRRVAYDLARSCPSVRTNLVEKLEGEKIDLTTADADKLFLEIIQQPLLVCKHDAKACPPPVVIIDALDECGGLDGPLSEHRRALLRTVDAWSRLPKRFKLMVSSRIESDINSVLARPDVISVDIPVGEDTRSETSEDLHRFFEVELRRIQQAKRLPAQWPGVGAAQALAALAAGLFIWATTAIKYIEAKTPKRRLEGLLKDGMAASLESLYLQVLRPIIGPEAEAEIHIFQAVVSSIILAPSPLTLGELVALRSLDDELAAEVCEQLQSVLGTNGHLRFLHQSFVDFVLDSTSSKQFSIKLDEQSLELSLACLQTMQTQLHFNISNFPSSYLCNQDVPDLAKGIQPELAYAAQFWAVHMAASPSNPEAVQAIHTRVIHLLRHNFLLWLEVLSATSKVHTGRDSLQKALKYLQTGDAAALLGEALRFLGMFAGVIQKSLPHIYMSALPFSPPSSDLCQGYMSKYPGTVKILRGGLQQWPAIQLVITGHSKAVTSVAFSPDGSQIASGSWDKAVRLWDTRTGQAVGQPLHGHSDIVSSVAFSPDGSQIASGSWDNTVRLWDARTGQAVGQPLQGHSAEVTSVAFSPDGSQIASGSLDKTVRLWDARTGQAVGQPLQGHSSWVTSVAFSPDGSQIASGSYDKTVILWDARTGQAVGQPLQSHSDTVSSVAFSPDGSQIASGSYDNTVRLWDARTGQAVGQPLQGHFIAVSSVAFSPDGSQITSGSYDKTIRLWDARTGQAVGWPLQGHSLTVSSVAFSSDGSQIASGSEDNTVRLWDARTGKAVRQPLQGHSSLVSSVAFSPDGSQIASGSYDKTIRLWDARTGQAVGQRLQGHSNAVSSVAFSPDGSQIASGSYDKTVRLWDARTGQAVGQPWQGHSDQITSVAFSPNGSQIASGSFDSTVRLWDAETGQAVGQPLQGHSNHVTSVAFSPDGSWIASSSWGDAVRLWDARTGKAVGQPLQGQSSLVSSVAFSPDGSQIVSGSYDKTIRLWDAKTGHAVGQPLQGYSSTVTSVAFSPDGSQIVSGSEDNTVRLWDAKTGHAVGQPLQGHSSTVASVAFSPDGSQIASGSWDGTVRLWDARTVGEPWQSPSDLVTSVAFSLNGSQLVSGSYDNTVRLWEARTGQAVGWPLQGHSDTVYSIALSHNASQIASGSFDNTIRLLNDPLFPGKSIQSTHFLLANSEIKDGWLLGPNEELLLWVPPDLQAGLWRPANTMVIGPIVKTKLNFNSFFHGVSWNKCQSGLDELD